MSAAQIAQALGRSSRSGKGFKCLCPAHDDKNPSLWLCDNERGGISGKCHAGCSWQEVRTALASRGLWPETAGAEAAKPKHRSSDSKIPFPVPDDAPPINFDGHHLGRPDHLYQYRNPEGQLVGCVARWDGSGSKEIRPFTLVEERGERKWVNKALPEPRPLYLGEQLLIRAGERVLIVEGEKAAEAACRLLPNMVTCTWAGGAKAVSKSDWSVLAGRDVVLWPDNDEAGRRAMYEVADLLKDVTRSVSLVSLPPDLPPKWDLGDEQPTGFDVATAIEAARPVASGLRRHVMSASELVKLPIPPREFIVEPIFVEGGLFMVYAERGLGKTWFALQASIDIAQGNDFFGFAVSQPRRVLYVDGEMSLAELQDRIRLLGGEDTTNLLLLPSERLFLEDRPLNISSVEDQARIISTLEDLEREGTRPDLIIFDNLSSLSGGVDENDNSALDGLIRWLVSIKHRKIAVLLAHHAGKSGAQRGASRREDFLDTSIALVRPKKDEDDDVPHEGAEFLVTFAKTRGKRPRRDELLLRLEEYDDGSAEWVVDDVANVSPKDKVLRHIAFQMPKTQREMVDALGLTKGRISQICSQLQEAGLLNKADLAITREGRERLLRVWPALAGFVASQDDLPI